MFSQNDCFFFFDCEGTSTIFQLKEQLTLVDMLGVEVAVVLFESR